MSHHLDSALARQDSRLDVTDQYVFRGATGTVLILNVNSSAAGAEGKPGFHPDARYEIKIVPAGTAVEDLTYRVTFGAADADGNQPVTLHVLTGADARADAATGELVAQGRTRARVSGQGGLLLWAGRAADPFYLDLTQLGAIGTAVANGTRVDYAGWRPETAANSFAGLTVHSIAIELPDQDGYLGPDRRIGVWSTTKLATDSGGWRQINRAGRPMMWPIFRPADSDYASTANTIRPADEQGADGPHLAHLVAGVVAANGTSADPAGYGAAVARRLLPDVLPYLTGTAAHFGFVAHNGRALADNAPEVMFSLALNAATSTGLTPDRTAATRSDRFPYVVEA